MISRWLLEMAEFNFEFIHVPGSENLLADYISRDPLIACPDDDREPKAPRINTLTSTQASITTETILHEQLKDTTLGEIRKALIMRDPIIFKNLQNYYLDPQTNLLMFRAQHPVSSRERNIPNRIVIPRSLQAEALKLSHITHQGVQKTYDILAKHYFWIGAYADTQNYVASCEICRSFKGVHPPVPLGRVPLPAVPGEFISLDIVGPFPITKKRNKYILTVLDHFSKHIELFPLSDISAETVAQKLIWYITAYGKPKRILTDRGTQFTSTLFKILTQKLSISSTLTSAFNPQCNGASERINIQLKHAMRCAAKDNNSWEDAMLMHKCIYNATQHSATKETPNFLFFARDLPLFLETDNLNIDPPPLFGDFAAEKIRTMTNAYQNALRNMTTAQEKQEERQLLKAKPRTLNIGQKVFVRNLQSAIGKKTFRGPYRIMNRLSSHTYKLRLIADPYAKEINCNINRIYELPERREHLRPQEPIRENTNKGTRITFSPFPEETTHEEDENFLPYDDYFEPCTQSGGAQTTQAQVANGPATEETQCKQVENNEERAAQPSNEQGQPRQLRTPFIQTRYFLRQRIPKT